MHDNNALPVTPREGPVPLLGVEPDFTVQSKSSPFSLVKEQVLPRSKLHLTKDN